MKNKMWAVACAAIVLMSGCSEVAPAADPAPVVPTSQTRSEVNYTDMGGMKQGDSYQAVYLWYSKEEYPDGSYRYCTATTNTGGQGGNAGAISCTELFRP